ncbi:Large proline-rich protein BAG6 [Liparis tanakae]|uniref:Large proline-rich protein BAG6 n=1 Tax=Liparis tanakae TaxID=230148 RepID=A0A4Z2E2U9_9TELE|nr:Large proline-rich protein BAG6 [Liparis tanakae]
MSFFRQQLMLIASHILRCSDDSFGPRLLQMCNQALFECLALNLHCLRGDQRALTAVINHRIVSTALSLAAGHAPDYPDRGTFTGCQRRMSSDISPILVNWMTSMMTMRLQVILEHIPISQEQIQNYIVHTQVAGRPRRPSNGGGNHSCGTFNSIFIQFSLFVEPNITN